MLTIFFEEFRSAFVHRFGDNLRAAGHADERWKKVHKVYYEHGGGSAFTDVSGTTRVSSQMTSTTSSMSVDPDVLESGDIRRFRAAVMTTVMEMRQQLTRQIFQAASTAAEQAGNSFDFRHEPLTADSFCEMIQRMEIPFDERGAPQMPSFYGDPELGRQIRELCERPEVELRLSIILQEKWFSRYTIKKT